MARGGGWTSHNIAGRGRSKSGHPLATKRKQRRPTKMFNRTYLRVRFKNIYVPTIQCFFFGGGIGKTNHQSLLNII